MSFEARALVFLGVAGVVVPLALVVGVGKFWIPYVKGLSAHEAQELEVKLMPISGALPGRSLDPPANAALKSFVERLRRAEAPASRRPSVEVVLLCSPEPNAFAIPGGIVGVTSGLFRYVGTERGLAGVLAHELGHLAHKHGLRAYGQAIPGLIAGAIAPSGQGHAMSGTLQLGVLSHSRKAEIEADSYGWDVVEKTYGDVRGSDEFFVSISKSDLERRAGVIPTFLRTHPPTADRLARFNVRSKQPVRKKRGEGAEAESQAEFTLPALVAKACPGTGGGRKK